MTKSITGFGLYEGRTARIFVSPWPWILCELRAWLGIVLNAMLTPLEMIEIILKIVKQYHHVCSWNTRTRQIKVNHLNYFNLIETAVCSRRMSKSNRDKSYIRTRWLREKMMARKLGKTIYTLSREFFYFRAKFNFVHSSARVLCL